MRLQKRTILFYVILIAVTVLVKVICAPQITLSGFTTVFAVALFAGLTTSDTTKAFVLPLISLFISDIIIEVLHAINLFPYSGFYSGQIYNYALFILITLIGIGFRNYRVPGIFAAALAGPTLFFLLSNFIVWKTQGVAMGYNKDISGLWQSYSFGLPFYRNSLISTILFLPVFIAVYHWMQSRKFTLAQSIN